MKLTQALKEWATAVEALTLGRTILLLRKGGIRERGRFEVRHNPVLLYPTYEHQNPELLKPEFAQVETVPTGWHPDTVPIKAWAEITHVFQVTEEGILSELQPLHIWNDQFAQERLGWKPKQPLFVLLLRTFQIPQITLPYRTEYGGCKSWLELAEAIQIDRSKPVLTDQQYAQQVAQMQAIATKKVPSNKALT